MDNPVDNMDTEQNPLQLKMFFRTISSSSILV